MEICKLIQGCIVLKKQSTDVLSPCRCQRVASMVIRGINRCQGPTGVVKRIETVCE